VARAAAGRAYSPLVSLTADGEGTAKVNVQNKAILLVLW